MEIAGLLFILFSITLYFLPLIVAVIRNHKNVMGVGLLNFFLGWTLLGWVGALIWSVHK